MSELKELKRLQEEEKTLVSLASLLTDQLNRLKVEELALLSKRRLQTTSAHSHMSAGSRHEHELYHAEEVSSRHNTPQEMSRTSAFSSRGSAEPIPSGSHMTSPQHHVTSDQDHMTDDESQDVIPLDLAVTSHEEGMIEYVEEEEEDEIS